MTPIDVKGLNHWYGKAEARKLAIFDVSLKVDHKSLTARQNVLVGLQVHGRGNAVRQNIAAEHILDLVGLGHRVDYLPANLSGGEKQRVAIARALVSNPEVVFADEPTAALDHETGLTVIRMLKALGQARGTTTVMVTHDNRILDLADRILTMEDGRIVDNQELYSRSV